jgi:signal transduction histidine kinase
MNSEKSNFLFFTDWNWQKTLFLIVAITLLGALAFNLAFLCTRSRDLINKPNVMNLDPYIISSKYYFPTSDEISHTLVNSETNWAMKDFDDSKWTNTDLGRHDLRTLDGYKEASGVILQRVKIRIPDKIYDLNDPIAILMRSIGFLKYELFLAGTLIIESPALIDPSSIGLFSIPKIYINKDKTLIIAVRGSFDPKDSGLFYNMPTLIGPKQTLDSSIYTSERSENTYPNVVAATKGGLLLFFILIFLVTNFQRFMLFFLVYATCNTLDSIFTMENLENIFNITIRTFLVFNLQFIGFSFLWFLVESIFGFKNKSQRIILFLLLITLNILLILYTNSLLKINLNIIFEFHNAFLTEILFAIFLFTTLEFKKQPYRKIANIPILVFYSIFALYFASYVGQRYLIANARRNGHHYIDILFFIFIAYIVASEFAKNQFNLLKQNQILELQKNDVNLGKSAARVAHDIRKPFSNLKIAIQTIDGSDYDPVTIKKVFEEVHKSIQFGEDLASQILQSKQNDILQFKPFSILTVIDQLKTVYFPLIKQDGIEFAIDIQTNSKILGTESKVQAIFQNIINNAIEALGNQTTKKIIITIMDHLDSIGNNLCKITIENNGPAIPKPILNKLFKQSITYGKETGTGLGLSGVKTLVDEMGGTISVYNLFNAKGVAFEINLLTDQNSKSQFNNGLNTNSNLEHEVLPSAETELTSISFTIPKQIQSIAVVDDDELIHMAWKLAWKGQSLYLYEKPEDLLHCMSVDPVLAEQFDIIITDRFFGEKSKKSGIELCHELNKIGYSKVVLCSGSDDITIDQSKSFLKVIPKQVLTQTQLQNLFKET